MHSCYTNRRSSIISWFQVSWTVMPTQAQQLYIFHLYHKFSWIEFPKIWKAAHEYAWEKQQTAPQSQPNPGNEKNPRQKVGFPARVFLGSGIRAFAGYTMQHPTSGQRKIMDDQVLAADSESPWSMACGFIHNKTCSFSSLGISNSGGLGLLGPVFPLNWTCSNCGTRMHSSLLGDRSVVFFRLKRMSLMSSFRGPTPTVFN